MDEVMYDKGYDTDGDIVPFYDSVEHEEYLSPSIEEETLPSKEELEALIAWTENPVNNGTTSQFENDITVGDTGTFVLISDKDMKK
eukprot:13420144-Ditylum_brightwellii.AAC.1